MDRKRYQQPGIAVMIALLFLLMGVLASVQPAQAGPEQQAETTPTAAADQEGTPALLLTPLATEIAGEAPQPRGALFATVLLLLCGMVGMLIGGVGIAMIMVRLRTRGSR